MLEVTKLWGSQELGGARVAALGSDEPGVPRSLGPTLVPGAELAAPPSGGQSLWAGGKHVGGHLPIPLGEKRLENVSHVVPGVPQEAPTYGGPCSVARTLCRAASEQPEAWRGVASAPCPGYCTRWTISGRLKGPGFGVSSQYLE